MNGQPILIILLFLGFVVEVVTSATVLMFGSLLLSVTYTYMLVAIFVLFVAYERLRDSLEERLGASQ